MDTVSYPALIAFIFLALSGLVLLLVRNRRKKDDYTG
ncbi:MAG: LPXTG cell wall anchor domain-containing protein [Ignavibacteria bacterium]|nr:LPXTG cell wall anchor domain-containing protein [Ignavibacteria bacterium]